MRKLLYYCPASNGGIADYAHEQAKALSRIGVDVTLLCSTVFPHASAGYNQERCLYVTSGKRSNRFLSRINVVRSILRHIRVLDRLITEGEYQHILFATYSEYLAPIWAWRMRRHAERGVIFGAIVHDPVRDYVVGPLWWHLRSITAGYSFLREAFVHEEIELDTVKPVGGLTTTVIPHGAFPFPGASTSRESFRSDLEIPQKARLYLSFGHIRDGKNLNLVLEALRDVPDAWLLVAGSDAAPAQRKADDYQQMAKELGVAERCRWLIGYQKQEDVANYFVASDVVVLTYSASFHSASGVLNVAAWFNKPVIVSCGDSNLGSMVERYNLGKRIAADDSSAIAEALRDEHLVSREVNWTQYENEQNWDVNAALVVHRLFTQ